ncbi:MAG: TIGR04076 family protein [Candidatus Heimdallarchaeota archaeon]
MYDCKITVIKRTTNPEIVKTYLKEEMQTTQACSRFEDSQEFLVPKESRYRPPEGFCEWAWADIRHDLLMLAYGGSIPHMKDENSNIVGCTDWFRPVYFKIERIDSSI